MLRTSAPLIGALGVMFTVILQQPLFKDSDARDFGVMFFRTVRIPFAPYIGLSIRGLNYDSWPIVSVRWLVETQEFLCTLEDRAPNESLGTTYDGLRTHLVEEEGWIPANQRERI